MRFIHVDKLANPTIVHCSKLTKPILLLEVQGLEDWVRMNLCVASQMNLCSQEGQTPTIRPSHACRLGVRNMLTRPSVCSSLHCSIVILQEMDFQVSIYVFIIPSYLVPFQERKLIRTLANGSVAILLFKSWRPNSTSL